MIFECCHSFTLVSYRHRLNGMIVPLLIKHGLKLRFEEVVYHDEF